MTDHEKIVNILRKNQMSSRPEFYSGRGATMSDLNSDILEGIYQGINKEFGKDAAGNFVQMVADLQMASATNFLDQLYRLMGNNWIHVKPETEEHLLIQKNTEGEYSATHGMISVMSFMSMGSKQDDTKFIIGGFCRKHGIVLKTETRESSF